MGALRDFFRHYGGIMTAYIFAGVGVWMIGMILLPQLFMVEKSLIYTDPAASAAVSQTEAAIDRMFVARARAQRDIADLERRLKAAESGEAASGGGGSKPAPGGLTALLSPQADREDAAPQDPAEIRAGIAARQDEIAQLEAEIAAADARLVDLRQDAQPRYGLENYAELWSNDLNRSIFLKTIWASILVTAVALAICYPIACYLAKAAPKDVAALMMLGLIVPYWINEILRTFAWLMILSDQGILNVALQGLGVIDTAIRWREGDMAVILGMTYAYILFMVFPIYNTIETLDRNQVEAARDLGAPWWRIHWRIVIPHAKPGIAVGCIITFMLAAGSYAVPVILGGTKSKWFTEIIYDNFYEANDWGLGSAYAFVLLLTCILFILAMMRLARVGLQDIAR